MTSVWLFFLVSVLMSVGIYRLRQTITKARMCQMFCSINVQRLFINVIMIIDDGLSSKEKHYSFNCWFYPLHSIVSSDCRKR